MEHTISEEGGKDTVGGDIIHIADLLGELLYVHETLADREDDFEENKKLTNNVLDTTNHLFSSTIGWVEISQNETRYESSSNLLSISDSTGYLLFKQSNIPSKMIEVGSLGGVDYNFTGSELNMIAALRPNTSTHPTSSYCYKFDNSELCLPETAFDNVNDDPVIEVSVQYKIDVDSYLFPTAISSEVNASEKYVYRKLLQGNTKLNNYLIGLAINNGTTNIDISSHDPVMIKFHHETIQVRIFDNVLETMFK